jgi:hypothetical protein
MTSIDNPNKFSTMNNANELADIKDDNDFPHVGIIKALSVGLGQNYAFGGYNATSVSDTSITFAGGKVMRDGKLIPVTGDTLTIAAVSGGTGDSYYLAVVPTGATPTITLRTPSQKGVTPDITAGDIIVAVIAHTGTNPMNVQFLTVNKTENHLSIATDNSGYTEVIKLEATGATTATITGAALTDISPLDSTNDRLLVRDATDNTLKLVAPSSVGSVYTDNEAIVAVEGEATLDLTGDVSIADKKFIVDTTTLVVNAPSYADKVGIGTATPSDTLSVQGTMRSSSHTIIGGDLDHNGTNIGFFGTNVQPRQTVSNLAATSVQSRPTPDPTAPSGFEPSVDVYVASLEQEIGNLRTKLDALIDALQLHGLIL